RLGSAPSTGPLEKCSQRLVCKPDPAESLPPAQCTRHIAKTGITAKEFIPAQSAEGHFQPRPMSSASHKKRVEAVHGGLIHCCQNIGKIVQNFLTGHANGPMIRVKFPSSRQCRFSFIKLRLIKANANRLNPVPKFGSESCYCCGIDPAG